MFTFKPFLGLSGFQIIPNVQIEENQMNQMLIQQQERLYFSKTRYFSMKAKNGAQGKAGTEGFHPSKLLFHMRISELPMTRLKSVLQKAACNNL